MTNTTGQYVDLPRQVRTRPVADTTGRARRMAHELLGYLVLLLVVSGVTVAAYNHSMPVAVNADDDVRMVFSNFYDVEQNETGAYRWSNGQGTVCLEQFGSVPLARLRVSLLGYVPTPDIIRSMEVQINSRPLAVVPLPSAAREYQLLATRQQLAGGNACVTLASDTLSAPGDGRSLGVPFRSLALQRITGSGLALPALLQFGANLLLALLGLWLMRYLGVGPWWALALLVLGTLMVGVNVAAGRVLSGVGVSRNVLPLVAVGALLGLGAWGARSIGQRSPWDKAGLNPRLSRDLVLMAFWSVVLWSAVRLLQVAQNRHGVWPLKAGVWPGWTPWVLIPCLIFALWLWSIVYWLNRDRRSLLLPLLLVVAAAIVLPVMLKVTVRGTDFLYTNFRDNPLEYIHDVPRVGNDPIGFLRNYNEISPTLAWHSANHPPGSVLMLWSVAQLLGPGPVPASWAVIVLASLGAVAAFWLGLRLGGPKLALLAAALYVVMPGHQVYSVTSMDAIFNASIGFGAVAFFLALEPRSRPGLAVLAGTLIALGLMFTYAATQLFFFGLALVILGLLRRQGARHVLQQAAIAAGTLALLYLLLYVTTGFNVVEGALKATANNARHINRAAVGHETQLITPPTLAYYTYYLGVNIVPFAWYLAPWGLAALTQVVPAGWRSRPRLNSVHLLALGLVAWVGGMWLSGIFIREVERIWGFTYPLAAAVIAYHVWQGANRREQLWRAALYISLFWTQSAVMRMLLNTYW